jgi:hypothetical protein
MDRQAHAMTDPISRPAPGITNDDGIAPIDAWAVHRAPGQGHEPPIWPGYRPIPPAVPPGPPFPTQAGPMPMAVPASRMPMGAVAPARTVRRSRTADVALVLAALVATAGVAFAIGRWSAAESSSATLMLAGSQFPADVQAPAGVDLPAGVGLPAGVRLPAGVDLPAGVQLPSAVEPTAAAVDEGPTTAGGDTTVAEPPAIDGGGDFPAGLPAMGGSQGPGAMTGFGRGGLQGMVSAIESGALGLTTGDGTIVSVATDASTAYVRETAIEAAEVGIGDLVSVQLPSVGFPGQGAATDGAPLIAEQVTLLPNPAG